MSYLNRRTTRRSAGSAELMYLLIVLAAGFATAWWAGHKIGMDLSTRDLTVKWTTPVAGVPVSVGVGSSTPMTRIFCVA